MSFEVYYKKIAKASKSQYWHGAPSVKAGNNRRAVLFDTCWPGSSSKQPTIGFYLYDTPVGFIRKDGSRAGFDYPLSGTQLSRSAAGEFAYSLGTCFITGQLLWTYEAVLAELPMLKTNYAPDIDLRDTISVRHEGGGKLRITTPDGNSHTLVTGDVATLGALKEALSDTVSEMSPVVNMFKHELTSLGSGVSSSMPINFGPKLSRFIRAVRDRDYPGLLAKAGDYVNLDRLAARLSISQTSARTVGISLVAEALLARRAPAFETAIGANHIVLANGKRKYIQHDGSQPNTGFLEVTYGADAVEGPGLLWSVK
ncbi:MAG: hypothetical protein WAS51_14615 [Ilumatobacteraceae bacterium]